MQKGQLNLKVIDITFMKFICLFFKNLIDSCDN
jgi:hypothetical protein